VSIYAPVFPPLGVPPEIGRPETWMRFAALRDRVESDPDALEPVRARLAAVEADLWEQADAAVAVGTPAALDAYLGAAWAPVDAALRALEA
jgi:hypothetical protein